MKTLIFRFVLVPLIRRDQRLRASGLRPDRWYWADLLAIRWGMLMHDAYPIPALTDADICKGIVRKVVLVVREYLPPDGITAKELAGRIIGEIDNDDVNPMIARIMKQEGKA
ncbi:MULTISPECIES: hypothetical protein [Alphaproteobacteria]|uniref:hypothetical protein n=1 Tax=Sphingopyxis sp. TaxID=1908224 RepID=UPI004033A8A0